MSWWFQRKSLSRRCEWLHSNPCGYGGTCIDGIGEFQCICLAGRGKRFESKLGIYCKNFDIILYVFLVNDIAYLPLPGSCLWQGHTLENNATWQHECNTCMCLNLNGLVKCTKIWCGNCQNPSMPNIICNGKQVCVPSAAKSCLVPPCVPYGECRNLESGRRVKLPLLPSPSNCSYLVTLVQD